MGKQRLPDIEILNIEREMKIVIRKHNITNIINDFANSIHNCACFLLV